MTFIFQQPSDTSLLEELNQCAKDFKVGGGFFAFATKGGVKAFFNIPNIAQMLKQGSSFELIVGIDAITNMDALTELQGVVSLYPTLRVRVFYHQNNYSTFHPKFSWFDNTKEVLVVAGSGNLTERGLGWKKIPHSEIGNWEAFGVQSYQLKEAEAFVGQITKWIATQYKLGRLRGLNDQSVLNKAVDNAQIRPIRPKVTVTKPGTTKVPVAAKPLIVLGDEVTSDDVLIRELPKTRGGQGDIGQEAHTVFFGHGGVDKTIYMQYVSLADLLNGVKPVWLFYNPASANYRLEIPESKDGYEVGQGDERMILVASKLDSRSFRYTLVRPISNPSDYAKLSQFLGPISPSRRLMRQRFSTADELRSVWPEVPSNLLPVFLPVIEA